jgi:uncharacterized membrane protein YkoI
VGKTFLNVLVAACFVVITGCKAPSKAGEAGTGPKEAGTGPKEAGTGPKEPGTLKVYVPTELASCRELVKNLNAPHITAVRVAIGKISGTPVEIEEIKHAGRTFYRVLIQPPAGKPQVINVDQQMLDAEQLIEPSSMTECKSTRDTKEQKIIAAIRLAQRHFPGRLAKARFGKYDDRFLYTVTVQDAEGKSRLVRVDAEAMKVISTEPTD